MTTIAARRVATRERQRIWRARQRDGQAVCPVAIGDEVIEMLIDYGWVGETESADRRQVGLGIAALLRDAAAHHKK